MSNMQRITSFKSFTELKHQESAMKLREENNSKRANLVTSFSAALEELGITSLSELTEEEKAKFIAKLFNEDRAEDIEDDTMDMGEPEDAKDGESLEANEGNAFIYAAAKAKADGKSEFEFNGKKYKVTLKKDTGLKESFSVLITEGTRGFFGKIDKGGNISAVYTHYDSYPENMLPIIKKSYKDSKSVDAVIAKGDNSGLEADIAKMNFYNDKNSMNPLKGKADGFTKFLRDAMNSGAEFIYLYDERDKKWYMADTYEDKALKPAFESVQEGNAFGDAVRKAKEAGEKEFEFDGKTYKVEEAEVSEASRIGNSSWSSILSDLKRSGWDVKGQTASKFYDEDEEERKLEISNSGDEVYWTVYDGRGKELSSGSFDGEGLSAGELDGEVWSYIEESKINEAEIKSDDEFKEYAMTVLKKAFGADFDEAKAQEVVDGILGKVDGDYGAAVGMLTSSLGESVVTEKIDVSYWEGYHEGAAKITSSSKVARAVEDAVEEWNDNNEDGKDNEVSPSGEKKVMNLAHDFFKAAGWISKDVIGAMIAQES